MYRAESVALKVDGVTQRVPDVVLQLHKAGGGPVHVEPRPDYVETRLDSVAVRLQTGALDLDVG